MPNVKCDLINKRFGRLVVLDNFRQRELKSGRLKTYWECRCDCGNSVFIPRDGLLTSTKSCGCLKSEKLKIKHGLAAKKELWRKYKRNAKGRLLEWKLNFEQFLIFTSSNCFYCDISPFQTQKSLWNNGNYTYNGIDRKVNTQGYTLQNCVTACGICNHAKHTMSDKEFLTLIKRIFTHHFVRGESRGHGQ